MQVVLVFLWQRKNCYDQRLNTTRTSDLFIPHMAALTAPVVGTENPVKPVIMILHVSWFRSTAHRYLFGVYYASHVIRLFPPTLSSFLPPRLFWEPDTHGLLSSVPILCPSRLYVSRGLPDVPPFLPEHSQTVGSNIFPFFILYCPIATPRRSIISSPVVL